MARTLEKLQSVYNSVAAPAKGGPGFGHGPRRGGPGPRPKGKPKNMGQTVRRLLIYVSRFKFHLLGVVLCMLVSTVTSLVGGYMIAPIIDRLTFLVTGKLPEMTGMQMAIDRAITALMETPLLAAVGERITVIPLYVLAALAILLGFSRTGITLMAFVFSLLTVALVYLIGMKTRGSRVVSILLAGVMVSSLFSAGTSYIKLVADPSNELPAITYWLMGSLSGTRLSDVGFALIPMLIGAVPLLLLRWRINILTLGEEEAATLGVNTGLLRLIVVLCATFLTAASVAVSGMIGWVGLVIPHMSRKLVGNDCRVLLPASMIMGAGFLLLVDNVSRNLLATEIPIGILTAFVGAPFFIYLMTRKESAL